MKYAVDTDHKRVYADMASPSENYFCSICKNKVILKSGSIREAHFAHTSNECKDTWTYEMSEWHQRMQRYFRRVLAVSDTKRNLLGEKAGISRGWGVGVVKSVRHQPQLQTHILRVRNRFHGILLDSFS